VLDGAGERGEERREVGRRAVGGGRREEESLREERQLAQRAAREAAAAGGEGVQHERVARRLRRLAAIRVEIRVGIWRGVRGCRGGGSPDNSRVREGAKGG